MALFQQSALNTYLAVIDVAWQVFTAQSRFDIDKLSRKLLSWQEITFKQFLKELKKKKVKLSLKEEAV